MTEEIEPFALSQEELLAALGLVGLPALPGFDDLAARVFGTLDKKSRIAVLAAAERALIAHGYAYPDAEGSKIDAMLTQVLTICTHPDQTWVVLHQPAGQSQRATYIHHSKKNWIAHVETTGIHQWLPLKGQDDIFSIVHDLLAPLAEIANAPTEAELPEATFAALATSKHQITVDDLVTQLQTDGMTLPVAKKFAKTLVDQRSMTAFARFDHDAIPPLQSAFTVVISTHDQWLLQMIKSGVLRLQQVPAQVIHQALTELVIG